MKYESVNEAGVRDGTNDLPMSGQHHLWGRVQVQSLAHNQSITICYENMFFFSQICKDKDEKVDTIIIPHGKKKSLKNGPLILTVCQSSQIVSIHQMLSS